MNCVKCGREIERDQVFCPLCLKEMEKYPVKPGTVVHIPKRPEDAENKRSYAPKKLAAPPEVQVRKLKKKVLRLRLMLAGLFLLCGLLLFAVSKAAVELDVHRFLGQNYSTEEKQMTEPPLVTEAPTETRWLPEITEP